MGAGGSQGPRVAQGWPEAGVAPVLPHLDLSFTIPCDEDPVVFIGGHGTHKNILILFRVHGELSQQTSIPVDRPSVDKAVNAAAQHSSCMWQARPGLQKNDLHKRGGPGSAVASYGHWHTLLMDPDKSLHPNGAPVSQEAPCFLARIEEQHTGL